MRTHGSTSSLLLLATLAAAVTFASPATSSPPPSPAGWKVLARNLNPSARPEREDGRVDSSMVLAGASLVFGPSPAAKVEREARIAAVQDPASPVYHRWLTPEQYASRFGVTPANLARATSWLQSRGFHVDSTSRTGTQLFFTGTAAQIEQAFHTEMHWYRVDGERHFAMSTAPSVPPELAGFVQGLHNLHSFRPHAPARAVTPLPDYQLGKRVGLGPEDFATIYDVAPLYAAGIDGTGMKVAVAGQTSLIATDYSTFRSTFGLSATQPDMILVPGSGSPAESAGDLGEANIDTQWAGGIAKNATLEYVYAGDNPAYSVLDAYAYVVNQGLDIAPVVSISYGGCEQGLSPADADVTGEIAAAGNLMGLTLLAASGDSGAADCDYGTIGMSGLAVDIPAAIPGVTGVGGSEFPSTVLSNTSFWLDAGAVAYPESNGASLETVWNDSTSGSIGAGGGGKSVVFAKPFFQETVTPNDGARDVPDVALTASDREAPYAVESNSHLGGVGGTSCAAPSFAAILTLVNQAVVKAGGTLGLGNANPMLYTLSQSAPAAFHDIVTGSNIVPCQSGTTGCPSAAPYQYGYSAGPGYDLASGLGSVDAQQLVDAWAALVPTATTLGASATSATVGAPVTLTATVASSGTKAMTGSVSFSFETYAPPATGNSDGGFDDSWILGTVAVTPTTAGNATATLSTAIPPGYDGQADVVATYSGDESYLASHSIKTRITIGGLTLAVTPLTATLAPNATVQFTATGGTPPYRYYIESDSTVIIDQNAGTEQASSVDATGLFTAGPQDGAVVLEAIDAAGATVWLSVTVAGSPVTPDAGADGGADATAPQSDAGTADASHPADAAPPSDGGEHAVGPEGSSPADGATDDGGTDEGGKAGCSCGVVEGGPGAGLAGGAAGLLLALLGARRRRSRTPG
ncbi:MAG TPA: protease pro-enzyme activation domain-containing protein [Polyangiaceae bacterium]|jgi:MYXO-CTERM domain-containing protein